MSLFSDDRPTRGELEHEARMEELDDECHSDPWYSKAYECQSRMSKRKHWSKANRKLDQMMEDFKEDVKDGLMDQAAYHKDVYAYHGVRRSDF